MKNKDWGRGGGGLNKGFTVSQIISEYFNIGGEASVDGISASHVKTQKPD